MQGVGGRAKKAADYTGCQLADPKLRRSHIAVRMSTGWCMHMQGSLPLALAAVAVNPAPLLFYAFVACRVAENTLNHSGLADCWVLDMLTLKTLPLRAQVSFHDAHHRFCNHGGRATNFAESFIVWDWMAGTLLPASLTGVSAAKMAAKAVQ